MKVMVRVPNWVGDAVMAVPALRELRRIFAEARITIVARPWVAGLFEGEGLADDWLAVSDARGLLQTPKQLMQTARRLRGERFDFAVLLQNAFGAALTARAGGARCIVGYPTDGRRALLDHVIPYAANYKSLHQVRYYLNIAARLERLLTGESHVQIDTAQPMLRVSDEQRQHALRLIEASRINSADAATRRRGDAATQSRDVDEFTALSKASTVAASPRPRVAASRLLALNPGATNSRAKQWLAARFAATADRLAERDGFQTIIVGAAGDIEAANEVARQMRTPVISLAGRTSIAELKAVLACTALVISNDTGAAHVSAALGVPTVVVFGPTEHVATRPLAEVATVVRHDVQCSPCMLRDCPIDHRCMTRVETNDVYRAAQNLLASVAR